MLALLASGAIIGAMHRAPRILLASASPRRRAMLVGGGFDVEVVPADVDESPRAGEDPAALVERLARAKAAAIATPDDRIVVAGDTVVVLAGEVLGKPRDPEDAAGMLRRLSGAGHEVIGGWCVRRGARALSGVSRTAVRFRDLAEAEIRAYVATGEPLDKAGAYAIQERGASFVAEVAGSFANVVGLPLGPVLEAIRALGEEPADSERRRR